MLFSNAINRKASFNLPAWTSLNKENLKSQGPATFQQCITGTDCSLSCYWEMLVQFMFISSFSSHLMPPKPRMCRGWKVPLSVIAHKLHNNFLSSSPLQIFFWLFTNSWEQIILITFHYLRYDAQLPTQHPHSSTQPSLYESHQNITYSYPALFFFFFTSFLNLAILHWIDLPNRSSPSMAFAASSASVDLE